MIEGVRVEVQEGLKKDDIIYEQPLIGKLPIQRYFKFLYFKIDLSILLKICACISLKIKLRNIF